jgi:hypothetical protein
MTRIAHKLVPHLPFIILAAAVIVAVHHVMTYW